MRSIVTAILLVSAVALRLESLTSPEKWTSKLGPFFQGSGISNQKSADYKMPSVKVQVHGRNYSFTVGNQSPDAVHLFDGLAEMTVVHINHTVAGTIMDPSSKDVISFVGVDGGELAFTSRNIDDFPLSGTATDEVEPEVFDEVESSGESAIETGVSNMSMLVVWTRRAECISAELDGNCAVDWETKNKIKATMKLAFEQTNNAFTNSGINACVHLAKGWRSSYAEEYDHEDSEFHGTMDSLLRKNDGKLDWVHSKRRKFQADIVSMLIDGHSYCGHALIGPREHLMFSVVGVECNPVYAFPHEIGHNLGCNHDRGSKNACDSDKHYYGYAEPSGAFRTIMSYDCKRGQCDDNEKDGCPIIPYFSNPLVTYDDGTPTGKPTGVADESDNAEVINRNAKKVAAYY
jgi:hypothetical protein